MDTKTAVSDLSAQIATLPAELVDDFLERHRGSFRVTLVPGYRAETLFGRPIGCSYPFVLHASGQAATDSTGQFDIDVATLLHCVGPGAPMPGGLLSPVDTSSTVVVPGTGIVATGTPIAVITGSGDAPAVFLATLEGFDNLPAGPTTAYLGWESPPLARGSRHQKVRIKSFGLDGAVVAGASFNWHLTTEVRTVLLTG